MLSWEMCWLHGHVMCDGSVMVGILGGGWLGEMGGGDGVGDHIPVSIVPTFAQCVHSSLEMVVVKVVRKGTRQLMVMREVTLFGTHFFSRAVSAL